MTTISRPIPRCPPIITPRPVAAQKHNLQVARHLRGTLEGVLSRPHLRHPLLPAQQPHEAGGHLVAPNGDRLVKVNLGKQGTGYVDPKTNQFYVSRLVTTPGKRTIREVWEGPYALPPNSRFIGKHFTDKQLDAFEKAANAGSKPGWPQLPIGPFQPGLPVR